MISVRGKIIKAIFLERPNRFLALVRIQGVTQPSHLPNPGRMNELLTPGTQVILKKVSKKHRKTHYDLIGVLHDGQLISVDSRIPNKLVLAALRTKRIKEFSEYNIVKPEHSYSHTRFDFFLANEHEKCLLEVKSCTLVRDGVALFPDAVTERERRHVRDLMKAKEDGYRACILFIVQRTDATIFATNDETDPRFGQALREATSKGVEVYAYYAKFVETRIMLKGKLKVQRLKQSK